MTRLDHIYKVADRMFLGATAVLLTMAAWNLNDFDSWLGYAWLLGALMRAYLLGRAEGEWAEYLRWDES